MPAILQQAGSWGHLTVGVGALERRTRPTERPRPDATVAVGAVHCTRTTRIGVRERSSLPEFRVLLQLLKKKIPLRSRHSSGGQEIKIREILRVAPLHHCARMPRRFCHQRSNFCFSDSRVPSVFFFSRAAGDGKSFLVGMMVASVPAPRRDLS